jgi:hypothetical protein
LPRCGHAIFSVFRGDDPEIGARLGRYDRQIHCTANPKDVRYSAVGRIQIGKDEKFEGVGMEPVSVRHEGDCPR